MLMSIENEFIDYMENFMVIEKLLGLNIKKFEKNGIIYFQICMPGSTMLQMICNCMMNLRIRVEIFESAFGIEIEENKELEKFEFMVKPENYAYSEGERFIFSYLTMDQFYNLMDILQSKWNY